METLTPKDVKKLNKLLINTRVVYWYFDGKERDYIGRIKESIQRKFFFKNEEKYFTELLKLISAFHLSNDYIKNHIENMVNPRDEWRERMKTHNNGGRETRDNKGQFVHPTAKYHTPTRDENGNIKHCNFNIIRYPKKARSKRTWKMFYEMFPAQAVIDNWDGNTSNKMK